jgi:hypothetical protein
MAWMEGDIDVYVRMEGAAEVGRRGLDPCFVVGEIRWEAEAQAERRMSGWEAEPWVWTPTLLS